MWYTGRKYVILNECEGALLPVDKRSLQNALLNSVMGCGIIRYII